MRDPHLNATGAIAMSTRHLHPTAGGSLEFYESEGTIYRLSDGKNVLYIDDGVVYSYDGKAVFYIDKGYLHEYGTGQPRYYFGDE
jgi:hypothetical protein